MLKFYAILIKNIDRYTGQKVGDESNMADYRKMYYELCSAASRAIDELEAGLYGEAEEKLRAALLTAEEIYIETDDFSEAT